MKIAVIIVRWLLGLLLLFSSVAYFLDLVPVPELDGPLKEFNEGMEASKYLVPLIKGVELVCGLALISGFYLPLALIVFFPIAVNILCVHFAIAQDGIPVGLFVMGASSFLIYAKRDHYKGLLAIK